MSAPRRTRFAPSGGPAGRAVRARGKVAAKLAATVGGEPAVKVAPSSRAGTRRRSGVAESAPAAAPAAAAPRDATRARLLAAGLALAQRDGLRSLTVRGVAAATGANLGSFVYHFGTRDAYVAEVLEQWYAPLMASLRPAAAGSGPPLARLRTLLREVVSFVVGQRDFIAQLLLDALAGEVAARRFLASMAGRHPALLMQVIGQAQRAGVLPAREPPAHLLAFAMAAVGGPVLLLTVLARSGWVPKMLITQLTVLGGDTDAAYRRIDWVLRGLAQTPPARKRAGGSQ